MPSPTEQLPLSSSRPAPRATRRREGRFVLQVAALLCIVAAAALALVALRPTKGALPPSSDSANASAPVHAAHANPGSGAGEREMARSLESLGDAERPLATDGPGAAIDPNDSGNGAASAPSPSNALAAGSSLVPRPDGREPIAAPPGKEARWAPADRPIPAAFTARRPSGATGYAGTAAAASSEASPSIPAQPSPEPARAAEESAAAMPAQPPPHAPTRAEIIERSKRLHEMRLEGLRQSGQLPPD